LGAATLVCGTQLFLLATWDWNSATLDVEPVAPASATISIEVSNRSKPTEPIAEHDVAPAPISVEPAKKDEIAGAGSEPEVTQSLAVEQPDVSSGTPQSTASTKAQVALEDRPHITAEARVGDHTRLASANVNLLFAEPRIMGEADVHRNPVVSTSANLFLASITAGARVGDKTFLASASANLSVEAATKDEIVESAPAPEVIQVGSAKMSELGTKVAGFNRAESTGTDGDAVASRSDIQITQAGSQSSLPQKTEAAQPLKPGAADNSPAHASKPPSHESMQRQQSEPIDDSVRQTGSISIAAAELKSRQSSPKVLLAQRASKPLKKKPTAKLEAKEKPMPKLAAKPNQRETKISQVTSRWKPMGLAPADKPSISATQSQPKRRDAGSYNAKIWSALARKKPKAGQRGSTTMTFAIGPAGALRYVRVSQSSSNPRLDQLAVATVRNAAPFPPPRLPKNGTAAYTIRIDFH
jgi:protein TonB